MKDQTTINMEKRIAENKKRIEQLNSDYKSAIKEGKELARDLRTHRLCNVGGLLETYLKEPELLDIDDVKRILDGVFRDPNVQRALDHMIKQKMTNSPVTVTAAEDDPDEDEEK